MSKTVRECLKLEVSLKDQRDQLMAQINAIDAKRANNAADCWNLVGGATEEGEEAKGGMQIPIKYKGEDTYVTPTRRKRKGGEEGDFQFYFRWPSERRAPVDVIDLDAE